MANNIDLAAVRQAYRNMGDSELLVFAKEEGLTVASEAYLLLKEELARRNIGKEIAEELDHQLILRYSLQQKKFEEDVHKELFVSAIEYALNEKKDGKTQYNIYAGLIERGISEAYANHIINKLDEWAAALHKDAVTDLQAGIGIMVLGAIVLYVSIQIQHFELAGPIIFLGGIVRTVGSLDKKRYYKKIVDNFNTAA